MRNEGKTQAIVQELKTAILGKRYGESNPLPSVRALMRRFSVARATVDAAMSELEHDGLVKRKQGKGTFIRMPKRETFGVVVANAYNPFYMRIVHGIESGIEKGGNKGQSILTASLRGRSMEDRVARAREFVEMCVRERIAGMFYQPLHFLSDGEKINRSILKLLADAGIPVVLIDSDFMSPPRRSEYDLVGVDNTQIGYELGRHVLDAGARRIIYFSDPFPAPTSLKRGIGVGLAVSESGFAWKKDNVVFGLASEKETVRRIVSDKNRPDAIIASDDYVAAHLIKTLGTLGLRIPDDILLAGVNGDVVAEESDPPLTTVVQPCQAIGQAAARLMLDRIADPELVPREVLLSTHLVVRASTSFGAVKPISARTRKGKTS